MSAQPQNPATATPTDDSAVALLDVSLQQLGIRYSTEITEKEIIISTKTEEELQKIKEHYERTHKNSKTFSDSFPYTILSEDDSASSSNSATSSNNNAADQNAQNPSAAAASIAASPAPVSESTGFLSWLFSSTPQKPEEPEDTVSAGKEVLKRLFGDQVFKKHAIDLDALFDKEDGATTKDRVLFSKKSEDDDTGILWDKYNEALVRRFTDVSVETIADVWIKGDKNLPEPKKMAKDIKLSGKVQEFFGVLTQENPNGEKESRLYFKFGSLWKCIFQPAITRDFDTNDKGEYSLRINKAHYIEYVECLNQGNTLLTVYKPKMNSKKLIAMTIAFGTKKLNPLRPNYDFIVDRSGSMGKNEETGDVTNYVEKIREFIKPFIENLKDISADSEVRLAFFDDKLDAENFNISNSTGMHEFMETRNPRGSTALYDTIGKELDRLLLLRNPNVQPIIFLMTDGNDDNGYSEERINYIKLLLDQFKPSKLAQPKIFTFGYAYYDIKTLDAIADKTGMPMIHLKSMADFKQIYDYLGSIKYEDKVVQLVINKNGISKSFQVPVPLDGNARAVKVKIPFNEGEKLKISVDGKESVVVVNDASKVPVASIRHWLDSLKQKAHQIVASAASDDNVKLKGLQTLQTEIDKGFGASNSMLDQEKKLLKETAEVVASYITEQNEIIKNKNEGLRQSQISKARFALGYKTAAASTSSAASAVDTTADYNIDELHIEDILESESEEVSVEMPGANGNNMASATASGNSATASTKSSSFLPEVAAAMLPPSTLPFEQYEIIDPPTIASSTPTESNNTQYAKPEGSKPSNSKPQTSTIHEPPVISFAPVWHSNSAEYSSEKPVPALMQQNKDGRTLIFASEKPTPTSTAVASYSAAPKNVVNNLQIQPDTCNYRPIQFDGKPSVQCQAKSLDSESTVDVVFTPNVPEPMFQNLDGNIMLGAIFANCVKSAWNYTTSILGCENPEAISKQGFHVKIDLLDKKFKRIAAQFATFPQCSIKDIYAAEFSGYREAFRDIKTLGRSAEGIRESFGDLSDSLDSFVEEFEAERAKATQVAIKEKSAEKAAKNNKQPNAEKNNGKAANSAILNQYSREIAAPVNYAALSAVNTVPCVAAQTVTAVQSISTAVPLASIRAK